METWAIGRLRPDPHNKDLFDDLPEDEANDLKESMGKVGQINPITVTPTGKIICGHQRYNALKAAGAKSVMVTIRLVPDDDELEIDLIRFEEQFRRRVIPTMTAAKIVWDFHKKRGVEKGAEDGESIKARKDLEKRLGISLQRQALYLALKNLTDEWSDVFARENIGLTVAYEVARMTKEEQKTYFDSLSAEELEGLTREMIRTYKRELKEREDRVEKLEAERDELRREMSETEEGQETLDLVDEARKAVEASYGERIATLEAERDAQILQLRREATEKDEASKKQIDILKAKTAQMERTALWEKNDVVHRLFKYAVSVTTVEPEDWVAEMRGKTEIAPFLESDTRMAEILTHWLKRFLAAMGESAPEGDTLRRVK